MKAAEISKIVSWASTRRDINRGDFHWASNSDIIKHFILHQGASVQATLEAPTWLKPHPSTRSRFFLSSWATRKWRTLSWTKPRLLPGSAGSSNAGQSVMIYLYIRSRFLIDWFFSRSGRQRKWRLRVYIRCGRFTLGSGWSYCRRRAYAERVMLPGEHMSLWVF